MQMASSSSDRLQIFWLLVSFFYFLSQNYNNRPEYTHQRKVKLNFITIGRCQDIVYVLSTVCFIANLMRFSHDEDKERERVTDLGSTG